MRRTLPTEAEARQILAQRRTRPALRPPPPAGRSLAPLIKKLDAQFGRGASALEPRWVEIVGERLARVTRPQKLTKGRGNAGGTLELRVAGPAALLVQHQSADIIQRVNLFLGAGSVEKLRIAQGPVKPLPASGAKPRPRGRAVLPPLPAATEAALNASVEAAPEGLKAALGKLGRAVLSQPPRDEGR
ncbi:DciA family protein [Brevundimonas olei]|uniref:DciA family protein n=1 Tax=Brevundimonas olei TaxID=657642 RepID=A0ABZ2IHF3_9CAUL